MPTYWIVVGSPENFEIAAKRGFDLFGFKSTRRRESGEMEKGDKLVFYLTGVKAFGGIATVQSETYEDHKKIFESEKKPGEDFPFRVKTKADIVLSEDQWLYVPDYVPLLEFTRKGATKSWALFFQGNLHRISETDYKLLERDMKAAAKRKPKAKAAAVRPAAKRAPTTKKTAARKAPARKTASKAGARKR
jgi:predicted RNA-binding protein